MNGPSVMILSPFRTRIVVAVATGWSASPPNIWPDSTLDAPKAAHSASGTSRWSSMSTRPANFMRLLVGLWFLVFGGWFVVVGVWFRVVGFWLLVVGIV